MIKVEGLTKEFIRKGRDGKAVRKMAVDGLSFEIGRGEIFGLLGPNGAGKTTTIRMLTMQTEKSAGRIWYDGMALEGNEKTIKEMIGIVPQHINFDNDLSVGYNMELHGRLHHMASADRQQRIAELLRYIELEDTVNMPPRQLSGGMKRRLLIARALIHRPKILFMDEPTVALDPQVRRRIWDLIREMAANGVTVLLTTHYIEEAENLCNRVAIINKGRLVDIDTPASFCQRMGRIAVEWKGTAESGTGMKGGREAEGGCAKGDAGGSSAGELHESSRQYRFFDSRQEAAEFMAAQELEEAKMRRSNLEDVFIELTGRREGL